jgi:hypothetical protein
MFSHAVENLVATYEPGITAVLCVDLYNDS